ncbi:hypothetical protein KKH36_01210 [Patescibacteria group bacterium]|nr:hypothetical protein [Patescibacteria group bacterium]
MNIRKKLDEIILVDGGDNWWKPELFIKNTLNILPKEIEVLENPPEYDNNYNCFLYALGLSNNQEIIKDSKGFIYDSFLLKLLEEKELEYIDNPQIGDWIIYRDLEKYPELISHIGVINDNNKIISKWAWGPLVKHNIFDVPRSYGDDIYYIKSISEDKAKQLYSKYKEFNKKSNVRVTLP